MDPTRPEGQDEAEAGLFRSFPEMIASFSNMRLRAILLCSIALAGVLLTGQFANVKGAGAPAFNNVVIILMENNGYCDVMTTCGGTGSYETQLAQTYGIAGNCQSDSSCSTGGYTAISHPSEGNYISLIGGDNFGHTNDGYCCFGINSPNIIDRVEAAGLSWQAWAEDASGSGTCNFNPPRAADHFAFLTFSDMNTASRCSHFLSTGSSSDTEFLAALNGPSPANFIWLTPNDNNNGHDTGVSGGDGYLNSLVPNILTSNMFKNSKAALFIVYDEGNSNYPNDYLYASWSGPVVKKAYVGSGTYSHYSFLSTLETVWGLQSLTSNDGGAPAMTEFFTGFSGGGTGALQSSFTYAPTTPQSGQTIMFTGSASGGTAPYTYAWDFGDGTTSSGATATHSYSKTGNTTVTMTATDSAGQTGTTTTTFSIASPGGSCTLCGIPGLSTSTWLLLLGGILGVVAALLLHAISTRSSLSRARKRLIRSRQS